MKSVKTKLEIALHHASKGLPVFPIVPNKRLPAITGWQIHATTDTEQIKTWWSHRDPNEPYKGAPPLTPKGINCNIGICCKDVVVAIDVDVKDDRQGTKSLQALIQKGLPKTFMVSTPSGGAHLLFRHPGPRVKSVVDWHPGIDVRGDGGFIVAAGSTGPGWEYAVLHEYEFATLPENIASTLPYDAKNTADSSLNASLITETVSPYSELPDLIPCGSRDDTLFKYACAFRERGYAKPHAELLISELVRRCEVKGLDSLTVEDGLRKLDQAWKNYTPSNPEHWTQSVAPQSPAIPAPPQDINNIKDALERFILCIRGSQVIDMSRQPKHAVMAMEEFKNAFKNVSIGRNNLVNVWLQNRNRQTVRDTIFFPKSERIIQFDGESFYNIYTASGQQLPAQIEPEKISVFRDHLDYLLEDRETVARFLLWCAVTVQRPWDRVPWMPLIITNERCGKGFIFETLQKVLGIHNTAKITPDNLSERNIQFNEWLSGTLLVCIDEIKTTHRWDMTEKLKAIISENYFLINHKHGKKGQEQVFSNLLAFSNHDDAMALSNMDGRLWVIGARKQRNPQAYYDNIYAWLESDGPAHLEKYLATLDISKFNYKSPPPMTAGKALMIRSSTSPMEQVILDAIEDRDGPFQADIVDITLVEQYIKEQMDKTHLSTTETYQARHIFTHASFELSQERYRVKFDSTGTGKRFRCRALRNVAHWREAKAEDVALEYNRAWHFMQGRPLPPKLEEAK